MKKEIRKINIINKTIMEKIEYKIPEGTKSMTCEMDGNKMIIEFIPKNECKFKDGDIVCFGGEHCGLIIGIFKKIQPFRDHFDHEDYIDLYPNRTLTCDNGYLIFDNMRYATEEEKRKLFDAMSEKGLIWNAKKKQVEKNPDMFALINSVEIGGIINYDV